MNIVELSTLKAQIRDLAQQGREVRNHIRCASGLARDALWNDKRAIGRHARGLLLVYGYLRGVPYRRIEPRCHEGGDAHAALLTRTAQELSLVAPERNGKEWKEAVGDAAVQAFRKRVVDDWTKMRNKHSWAVEYTAAYYIFEDWVGRRPVVTTAAPSPSVQS
jgi:hypothetical protein